MNRVTNWAMLCFLAIMVISINASQNQVISFNMKVADIITSLTEAINARGISTIARGLQGIESSTIKQVLTQIIVEENSPLSLEDKIKLLLLCALECAKNNDDQFAILNLYGSLELLRKGEPILFVATTLKGHAPKVIAMIKQWLMQIKDSKSALPDSMQKKVLEIPMASFTYALAKNDVHALQMLLHNGIDLSKENATNLLWLAIEGNKKPLFVSLLLKAGANINDDRKGYSPLMKAVEKNNKEVVRLLVENGAEVNKINKLDVGTALQIAIEKGYASIDQYLREHGAQETKSVR